MKSRLLPLSTVALAIGAPHASAEVDAWHTLGQIDVTEIVTDTTYEVRKTFPPAFENGAIEVEITGYAVPRLPGDTARELILMSDMGTCPLCGSLDHGASLEVLLDDAIPSFDEGTRLSLRGTLEPVTDPETWQAARLVNARVVAR